MKIKASISKIIEFYITRWNSSIIKEDLSLRNKGRKAKFSSTVPLPYEIAVHERYLKCAFRWKKDKVTVNLTILKKN